MIHYVNKHMHQAVSAIVPAYNEEKRIKNVLQTLSKSRLIDEVICINDGSVDSTVSLIKQVNGVKIINLKKNHGKAYAIGKGLLQARGDIVVFIDADIDGLSDTALSLLINPLKKKTYQAVIGYRANRYEMFWFRPLTGERSYFRQDLLPHVATFKKKGYGLELFLNYLFHSKPVKRVLLPDVKHIWKRDKYSYMQSVKGDYQEVKDLFREIITQKHPLHFFYYAYLHGFYL